MQYAKSHDFVTQLYLCGHSQGGLLTMLIGGMCADDFKAILPLSPAWMIPDITRHGVVLGQSFDAQHIPEKIYFGERELSGDYIRTAQMIHVEDAIERFKGKVLIVHGDEDETVPFSYAQKAAELYADAKLVTVRGADHCFDGHTAELAAAVKAFFEDDMKQ
ncbi:MAG: S9 family peptidase [Ruminococcus sp.]|nr:S9 family peptidase [Ruminococcus sp.]